MIEMYINQSVTDREPRVYFIFIAVDGFSGGGHFTFNPRIPIVNGTYE